MEQNIYEFLYVVISSSISHAILVIGIIYVIFHIVIIKDNEDQIAKGFIDYLRTYVDIVNQYVNNDPNIDKSVKDLINNDIDKSIFIKYVPDITDDIKQKAADKTKSNDEYNQKYFRRSKIILSVMTIILVLFLLIDYLGFRKYIKFLPAFGEISLSFLVASISIIIYEYLFAYAFMYNYLDYNYDKLFTEKLIYVPDKKVYNY